MNCEVCHLNDLEVEHYEIREVLRCILHTIIFHRTLGLVHTKEIDLELFEITYRSGFVSIHNDFVKRKQAPWFTNKIERLYWENWCVNLNVAQQPKTTYVRSRSSKDIVDSGEHASEERSIRRASQEASLREVLFQIVRFFNDKKDHVPLIPNREGVISFPYEITIPSSSNSAFGMDMIKRMLQTGHPTMLS